MGREGGDGRTTQRDGTGWGRGRRAAWEQSCVPRAAADHQAVPGMSGYWGAEPIASKSKVKLGSRGLRSQAPAPSASPAPAGPAAPPVPPTSRRAGTLQLSPDRGAFLVPCLCFLFSAFVLPSLVLCSSLSFVPTPLVSLPFDALSLPSSWCFSFPGFLSWRLFSLAALCLAFLSFLLPGPLLGSHGPGPDCLQIPICLVLVPGFPCLYVLS